METSEFLASVEALHREAQERGLFFQTAEDETLRDRNVTLGGQSLLSFSSCSYLGLEYHPALIEGVHRAVDRWGTQFSSSRGYISAPPYAELKAELGAVFGGSVMVTSSTTLGHQIVLGVLATEKDAIVMDHQVHHSVQTAATLARANGARVERVRHHEMERAVETCTRLARTARTVWFACDGVFSMYGDLVSTALLNRLLEAAPNIRLYVDDAHGMSWAGSRGQGSFLSRFPLSERVVVATSLNKAFAAAGGCFVFASEEERDRVRRCGAPYVFSGPLQPPMIGAAVASARLHRGDLSLPGERLAALQSSLRTRVDQFNRGARSRGLPLLVENGSPIFFIRLGLPRVAFAVAEALRDRGMYVNVSMFPTVPLKRAGIRIALTALHTEADVERLLEALEEAVPAALAAENMTREALDELFAEALPPSGAVAAPIPLREALDRTAFAVESADHIRALRDAKQWDEQFASTTACSVAALQTAERVFRDASTSTALEHRWAFDYRVVRDRDGHPVAAAPLTVAQVKDDMLMRETISRAVERRREENSYFLTTRTLMTGSLLSEGPHLWVDRARDWKGGLRVLLEEIDTLRRARDAKAILLRDLPADDAELGAVLRAEGYVAVPGLPRHVLDLEGESLTDMMARLGKRARQHVRALDDVSSRFVRRVYAPGEVDVTTDAGAALVTALEKTYLAVARRKYRINVFPLPRTALEAFFTSTAWEVMTLHLDATYGGPPTPVAWVAAHVSATSYAPFVCGLDYDHVLSAGAYRQLLLAIVRRGYERGARQVHLGMDADMEKSRFGTRVEPTVVYAQVGDLYQGELLREIVEEVGVSSPF